MDKGLNQQNLPIIDREIALKLAGNKQALATELLDLLISGLQNDLNAIYDNLTVQNLTELARRLHKLHGACSYCGVTQLKNAIGNFEHILKKQKTEKLTSAFKKLELAAHQLIEEASK